MAASADTDDIEAPALAADFRALVGKLRRRMREQSMSGALTPPQVSVLLRLEKEGPATVSSLARDEGMRPQSMSAIVAPLVSAGLVRGAPDIVDKRQTILSPTEAYRKKLREGRPARQDWLSRAFQTRLSAQEQRKVAVAIELLKRLVDS